MINIEEYEKLQEAFKLLKEYYMKDTTKPNSEILLLFMAKKL